MSDFTVAFRSAANAVLAANPAIRVEWSSGPVALKVNASSDNGFDVKLVCEDYGLYPYAGDWHGVPWDVTMWTPDELSRQVTEFLQAVLSKDSKLQISYSNGKPFKWVLHHRNDGQPVWEETGLLFFNWFGRRTHRTFQNDWLSNGAPN